MTLHYISLHLHPYGTYVELRDRTLSKTVWKGFAHYRKGTTEIVKSDVYSSEAGIPVFKDHDYAIIAEYDNTSGKPVDAMAMLYLYFADPDFRREPGVKEVASFR
jgi:hypothetical protein